MFHHQLGVVTHFQLISFHGVGKIKPCYHRFVLGLVVGGLEPEPKRIFYVDPIRGSQDQACAASLGIGRPIYG